MNNLSLSCSEKKLKISFTVEPEEIREFKQLVFQELKLPKRFDSSYYEGDFGLIYQMKLFSKNDFDNFLQQIQ